MAKIKKKWDSLDKNIQKWATRLGAIATIMGIVTAGGGFLIHQVDNAVETSVGTIRITSSGIVNLTSSASTISSIDVAEGLISFPTGEEEG